MKAYVRSIVLILPLLLSSCVHKTNQAQVQPQLAPPIEDAPLPKPDNAPANLPPPVISLPEKKEPQAPQPPPKPPQPAPTPKHKKPSSKPNAAPSQPTERGAQATEQASKAEPEVPAVGKLSAGDPSNLRDETLSMIADTDRGLSGINRKLNDQEEKTSLQIKEFLKQARAALVSNDVSGAHTLAVKAKVLYQELGQ